MTNFDNAARALMIEEATLDIRCDGGTNLDAIFDLATDHFGSDDDAHYMIHSYASDSAYHEKYTSARSLAFLRLLPHDPNTCTECD